MNNSIFETVNPKGAICKFENYSGISTMIMRKKGSTLEEFNSSNKMEKLLIASGKVKISFNFGKKWKMMKAGEVINIFPLKECLIKAIKDIVLIQSGKLSRR